ncbi:MAG: hypothetical protein CMN87_13035 [Stappia sp.]|uniref:energy transducer TonB family protein n=1 Tax=Stappia sp. TaxID=1870903 RepID=UPI000C4396BA|nr:TonB family protein [Stappia sp.]MBM20926.1 hypothetical protein [Stappia sp.]
MKLRTWHLAVALSASLALHAGAAGVYLSGSEPALMTGGSPAMSAEIGEVFADVIQAGTSQEGEEVTETEVQQVIEPVDAPEADEAVEESTALEESVSPEATDPTEVPVLETATEVSTAEATETPVEAPETVQAPAATDAEPVETVAAKGPELSSSAPAEVAYAVAAPVETARAEDTSEAKKPETAVAKPVTSEDVVEADTPQAVPMPRGRPKDLKIAEVKREAPARKAKTVNRQKKAPARARKSGGSQGAGGRAKATAQAGGAKRRTARVEAGNASVSNYQGQVLRRLQRARRSVRDLRHANRDAHVRFVVTSSGGVSSIKLVRSSGNGRFDSAALSLVRRAAPFPPIPPALGRRSMPFTVPIGVK